MVTLKAKLLALMLSMPSPWGATETPQERGARLDTIAEAIIQETKPQGQWLPSWTHRDRAALALVLTYHESGRWRRDVHDGTKRGDHGRSVCLGQIMSGRWIDRALWRSLPGVSLAATRNCIRTTLHYLSRARRMCASGEGPSAAAAAKTFTMYGTGHQCAAISLGHTRGRHFRRIRARL